MDLLNLAVRIFAKDEASDTIENVSGNVLGKLADAAINAAKALAGLWAVKKVGEFGKAAFDAYSQFEQLEGGVAKLYGNAGMTLEQYADSVGKTVDEVSADYERNAEAQKMVMENAQQAWKTAGMDANAYMQTATSFSASLINSLGGDTAEAARLTDEAMRAMSDNVNTFGTDSQNVQNAFQGFAKQNYMMLDNLKLGYGGTKTEMERLIKDAASMTKEQEDLNMTVDAGSMSFDNIVKAIQVVQKHQGIYGTTTREALNTIEGSMNATKAAWQNLVAEFGKPDADIAARVGDMITAIFGEGGEGGLARNVVNEVTAIGSNMVNALAGAIDQGVQWLMANGPTKLGEAMSLVVETLKGWTDELLSNPIDLSKMFEVKEGETPLLDQLVSFGKSIWDTVKAWAPNVMSAASGLFAAIGQTISDNVPFVLETVGGLLADLGNFILEQGPDIAAKAYETLLTVVETILDGESDMVDNFASMLGTLVDSIKTFLIEHGPDILAAAMQLFSNIGTAIANHGPTILGKMGELVGKIVGYVLSGAAQMLQAGIKLVKGLLDGSTQEGQAVRTWFSNLPSMLLDALGSVGSLLYSAGTSIIQGFWNGLTAKFSEVKTWVSGIGTWIQEHKGPREYDLGLLVDNGQWIMQSLEKGLREGYDGVQKFIGGIGEDMEQGFRTTVSVDALNPTRGLATVQAAQQKAGDVYYVYLTVEDRNDFDGMALAFVDAVAAHNRLAGKRSTVNVRYA